MKICIKCEIGKDESEYYQYTYKTVGTCKSCWNVGNMKKGRATREWMASLKEAPCTDCGIQYPPHIMEWDHVRGTKVRAVAAMLWFPRDKIIAEIEKCELVCANCHRDRTYQSRELVALFDR